MHETGRSATAISRRGVLHGSLGLMAAAAASGRLNAAMETEPPTFATARYQFIELDPAQAMPKLKVSGLDGRMAILQPAHDRVTLVNFWATWCPACRTDLSLLEQFRQSDGARAQIVTVATDREGAPRVAPFLRSLGLTHLPAYLDPDGRIAREAGRDQDPAIPFALYGMPITFLVTPSGAIAGYILGAVDWSVAPARRLLAFYAQR